MRLDTFSSVDDVIKSLTEIDWDKIVPEIERFIIASVNNANANGVVIGLSGGVDSAASFALAVKALGPEKVRTLIMPDNRVTPKVDVEDAVELSRTLGVQPHIIEISPIVDVYTSSIPVFDERDQMPVGNLRARIRMSLLYYYANKYNYIVLGTGDRSEILIGYFTKYGDGAVDVLPIGCFYKSQVRKIAEFLGVPEKIAYKPSSPRLVPDHLAEKELGITYNIVDSILHLYFDLKWKKEEICSVGGITCEHVERVLEKHKSTEHKRKMPPSPPVDVWFKSV